MTGLVVYLIPQYDAHQTRRVQAMTRAFSIARVERAKLTDPRPKRAAKANGALDRPSQWVERRSMRVLCAAEMSKSATAER